MITPEDSVTTMGSDEHVASFVTFTTTNEVRFAVLKPHKMSIATRYEISV